MGIQPGEVSMNRTWLLVAALAFASTTRAQSNQQFRDGLFCHDAGMTSYQALADYHDGMPLDAALQRVDGYLCTDHNAQLCDAKRSMLADEVRFAYKNGQRIGLDGMPPAQFLYFNDRNQTLTVSRCMKASGAGG